MASDIIGQQHFILASTTLSSCPGTPTCIGPLCTRKRLTPENLACAWPHCSFHTESGTARPQTG